MRFTNTIQAVVDVEQAHAKGQSFIGNALVKEDVHQARKDRENYGTRSAAEVRQLREEAARDASLCADCFAPIGPHDSVTMVGRLIHIPAIPRDKIISVPICLTCWLIDIECDSVSMRDRHGWERHSVKHIERFRCEGCGRPMRVHRPWMRWLYHTERVCSTACLKPAANKRARERRRVEHKPRRCAVCGVLFVPTRSDQKTHSNKCRQALHRKRHRKRAEHLTDKL